MEQADYNRIIQDCLALCEQYAEKGMKLIPLCMDSDIKDQAALEEIGIQSRYLPRGFYCPSPDLEQIITNMRRGKIARRKTKRLQPTNRYLFDQDGKLFLAETFYPNGCVAEEYIFYEKDVSFGLELDSDMRIYTISIALYKDGRICAYLWAACNGISKDTNALGVHSIIYETYSYTSDGYLETNWYNISILSINIVTYVKYRFALGEDNKIIPGSGVTLKWEKKIGEKTGDGSLS